MSATKHGPNRCRKSSEPKQKQKIHKGLALTRAYLLSRSVLPSTPSAAQPGIWESFKLPALPNMACRRTVGVTHPVSFFPGPRSACQTISPKLRLPSQNRASFFRTDRHQSSSTPLYAHFSLPLRPVPRLRRVPSPARSLELGSLCAVPTSLKDKRCPGRRENLSVQGIACSCRDSSPVYLKQLHVFLPSEGAAEDDEDEESVDEGFLDEVEHKARGTGTLKPACSGFDS